MRPDLEIEGVMDESSEHETSAGFAPAGASTSRIATSAGPVGTPDPVVLPEIDRYELDGIPLFHLPRPGTTTLSLQFRVGRADERIQEAGMTHLAEHLIMSSTRGALDSANGTTEPFRLTFIVRGSQDEASRFLRDVCHSIENPPMARIGSEANVLRTEAGGRQGAMPYSLRLVWQRTGYQGIGTYHLPEFFLRSLDEVRLRAWMTEHLVAGNAVIWIAGSLPDDLFIDLPPGPRRPPPMMSWVPGLETPTVTIEDAPAVGASFVVERSIATTTAFRAVDRRLKKALRVDRGLGYEVAFEYTPFSASQALVGVWSTCFPDAVHDVERVILETLDAVAQAGATHEEIERQYGRFAQEAADPESFAGRLDSVAKDALFGLEPEPAADLADKYWRLTPSDVAAAMQRAMATMILALPPGATRPQRPFKPYPGPATTSLGAGRSFPLQSDKRKMPWGKDTTPVLYVGEDGVAVDSADHRRRLVGIRWAEAAGVVHESGGSRQILGLDGYALGVNPGEWRDGRLAVSMIDRFAPRGVVVPLPT